MFWYDASLSHLPSRIISLPACQRLHLLPPPLHTSFPGSPLSPCSPHCAAAIWHWAAAGNHLCSSVQSRSTTWDTEKLMSRFQWENGVHTSRQRQTPTGKSQFNRRSDQIQMTGYGYISLFVCSSSRSEGSAFLFPPFSDFFAWIITGCWQTASQMLDQWTLRDNVIGCTQSLLPCSLWTYQSSLTYVFKAVLLAACSSCHGNLNAISPLCLYRSISWKLFFFFVSVY